VIVAYLLLNEKFEAQGEIEDFGSFIWTERYSAAGDFELHTAASTAAFQTYLPDYYIWSEDSDRMMIIDTPRIDADEETGAFLNVTGDSLEMLLKRRIIWNYTNLTGSVHAAIKRLISENFTSPSDPARRVPNFTFVDSTDPKVLAPTVDAAYMGDNVYSVVQSLCSANNLGFKVTMPSDGQFVVQLYAGADRSDNQMVNDLVRFSPDLDNISNSSYILSKKDYGTVTLIAGSGEVAVRRYLVQQLGTGPGTGLTRREIWTDASRVSKEANGTALPADVYDRQLMQVGSENLYDHRIAQAFDGKLDMTQTFAYNKDFFLGDILQLENEYGAIGRSRVVEFIRSYSETGFEAYPTLESIEL
jgi:hypothetical protein